MVISRNHAAFLRIEQGEVSAFRTQLLREYTRIYNVWAAVARKNVNTPEVVEDFTASMLAEHFDKIGNIVRINTNRVMKAVHSHQLELLGLDSDSPSALEAARRHRDVSAELGEDAAAETAGRTFEVFSRANTALAMESSAKNALEYAQKRLAGSMGENRARMIAEDQAHRAGNKAVMLLGETGNAGFKQWKTRNDARVRTSHRRVHNVAVPVSETFSVGQAELSFPGDPNGPPQEVINCRCHIELSARKPRNARSNR